MEALTEERRTHRAANRKRHSATDHLHLNEPLVSRREPEASLGQTIARYLMLYFDYHGVLDAGTPKIQAMADFMRCLRKLQTRIKSITFAKTLLSFAPSIHRIRETLRELVAADIVSDFDELVFTTLRTSHERQYASSLTDDQCEIVKARLSISEVFYGPVEVFYDHPKYKEVVYSVFTGGKDEFIHGSHGNYDDFVLFVDDKASNLTAVCDYAPWRVTAKPRGIEMRRHHFRTQRGPTYEHCSSLEELLQKITSFAVEAESLCLAPGPSLPESGSEIRKRPREEKVPTRNRRQEKKTKAEKEARDSSRQTRRAVELKIHLTRLGFYNVMQLPHGSAIENAYRDAMKQPLPEHEKKRKEESFLHIMRAINKHDDD